MLDWLDSQLGAAMRTRLCDRLGIEFPAVQAPVGRASGAALAAAVSNAGGLGMLALTWTSPEAAREEIRRTRMLTDKPFGVNLVLAWPQDEGWRPVLRRASRSSRHLGRSEVLRRAHILRAASRCTRSDALKTRAARLASELT